MCAAYIGIGGMRIENEPRQWNEHVHKQPKRSRAHPQQQEVPGSTYPDHEVRAWKYPITPHWRDRWHGTGCTGPPFPLLSHQQGRLGRDPLPPPQDIPLPQGNYPSGTSFGENLTSASKSGSEVTILTQDDHEEYFWLNGTSLRGQTAEIETSAGWPARFSIALLYGRSGKPGRAGTTRTNPWQAGRGQEFI
jgi:hypothetical protein